MSSKPTLKLDWCSHEAAKYAVEKWHYSRCMPVSKSAKVGAWEGGRFIGCVMFAWGANPHMASTVGVGQTECAELVRVALTAHVSPVSRIVSIAVKLLRQQSPGLRVLVSYADPYHGHHGGIYQAGGWVYLGATAKEVRYLQGDRMLMRRAYTGANFGKGKKSLPADAKRITVPGKHKYVMPLDDDMRKRIAPLAKPYPKRTRAGSDTTDTPANHAGEGGSTPTPALHPPTEVPA